MGFSKTEINLRRLLTVAPQQQNQAKLIHYVATLREQLELLAEERTPDGLPRPYLNIEDRTRGTVEAYTSEPVKLEAQAHAHIEKHRKLQENLTDEMVGLARKLKESSLLISQSVQNKVLNSTEKAIEQSLGSTGHAMKIYSESSKTTCFTWL